MVARTVASSYALNAIQANSSVTPLTSIFITVSFVVIE
jgi:hypothetical protein